jgi:hypothetical protein
VSVREEELLRQTIASMTSGVRGMDGLAANAIVRGRRIRRRQRAIVAAGLMLVMVLTSAVLWPFTGGSNQMADAPQVDQNIQLDLPGSWRTEAAPGKATASFGDRTLTAPAGSIESASGDYVMVATPGQDGFNLTITPVSGGAGKTTKVPGAEAFQWAPAQNQILATLSTVDEQKGFAIIDAPTGEWKTYLPVAVPTAFCGECKFTWHRDGRQAALWQAADFTNADGSFSGRGSTYLYSTTTGQLNRTLPGQINVTGPYSWSPDGSQAISQHGSTSFAIEVETGELIRQLPGAAWYVAADYVLVLRNLEGKQAALYMRVSDGQLIETKELGDSRDIILTPG